MKTIMVTAATANELSFLIGKTGAVARCVKGLSGVWEKTYREKKVILALTGMGKVNAALSTASLLCSCEPDLIINTGCAGAYEGSGLSVGDVAIARSEVYGDEGVLAPSGWMPVDFIGIPMVEVEGKRYFNEIPLSGTITDLALGFADDRGICLVDGRFVTVSTCSGTSARGAELASLFGAICENMEGAAVAHVALRLGVDCIEIRGVSNMVEDRDLSRWDIAVAADNAQRFLLGFLDTLYHDADPC